MVEDYVKSIYQDLDLEELKLKKKDTLKNQKNITSKTYEKYVDSIFGGRLPHIFELEQQFFQKKLYILQLH